MLTALVTKVLGSNQRSGCPTCCPAGLGIFRISGAQVVIFGLAAVLTVPHCTCSSSAPCGASRSVGVSDDAAVTGLLGAPSAAVILLTFALSGALGGAAGLLQPGWRTTP